MTQPLYIISSCAISPQLSYDSEHFLAPPVSTDSGKMYVGDVDYHRYISPVAIRRMSRMLKIGITAGMRCLEKAGVKTPLAIITGTSRGSVTDMEVFMKDMITLEEEALNPSGFIQSTYNSVNGWLALMAQCKGYNQAFVHRGFSFELAVFDAMLTLAETDSDAYILCGSFDELTEDYYKIRDKAGFFKRLTPPNLALLAHYDTPGSIAGEGAAFFTVSNNSTGASCAILDVEMIHQADWTKVKNAIDDLLIKNGLVAADIDILLSGMNGDSRNAFIVEPLLAALPVQTSIVVFKHLCGEYATASSFGIWLAHSIFNLGKIPPAALYRSGTSTNIRNMLFFNVTISNNVSVMLLRACV
ncbi:MAG: beta-ketoacyl synthase chain length factor [Taibaiella sp.]|nr:beta-ketoacyl synthase chain length factor [Taibaiella sp.]